MFERSFRETGRAKIFENPVSQGDVARLHAANAVREICELNPEDRPEDWPETVAEMRAAIDLAQQPKPPTKRQIREAARVAREKVKAEKERERQRIEAEKAAERARIDRQRFLDRAAANGQRVLAAERKRLSDRRRAGADDSAFSRDF